MSDHLLTYADMLDREPDDRPALLARIAELEDEVRATAAALREERRTFPADGHWYVASTPDGRTMNPRRRRGDHRRGQAAAWRSRPPMTPPARPLWRSSSPTPAASRRRSGKARRRSSRTRTTPACAPWLPSVAETVRVVLDAVAGALVGDVERVR